MATTADLRKTTTDFAKTLTGPKPFYAVAGVGDLAVEKIKAVPDRVSKLRTDLRGEDAKVTPSKIADKVTELPKQTRKLGTKLVDVADEQVRAADERYVKLIERGEDIVKRVRTQKSTKDLLEQAKDTVSKARNVRGAAERGTKATTSAAKSTVTSARKTATRASKAATVTAAKVGD
ncbi:MAG: hypothetical protein ACT4PP_02885 [Sporichthyaceae bacterium]